MKKILIACVVILMGLTAYAQENITTRQSFDKSKLTLKPNSREFAAVRMTNQHQRMELRKKRTMMLQKQLLKKRLQHMRKGQRKLQQQRKIIQQRRAIRKKMWQQQRRKNLRR